VDIFLLISAFLLTLSFVRKVEAGTSLNLLRHWLHLFKRLLPAAVVVILGVLAGTWLILPQSRWPMVLEQAWASLLYRQNWLLADTAVDYYARDHAAASPLQHFWSLSIQGQVFILWPLVFAASAVVWKLLRRRWNASYRGLLAAAFAAILAASLSFAVDPAAPNEGLRSCASLSVVAVSVLRSPLAPGLPLLKPGKVLRLILGWAGLAAMVSCGLLLTVDRAFPGFVALWPTLAAAAIIVAGQSGSRFGVDRLLSWKPLVSLGDNSYALYLWHWPVLVLALAATGVEAPTVIQGAAIIAASVALAVLTTRFVEKPLREWHWPQVRSWRTAVVVVACCALLAGPVAVWQTSLSAEEAATAAQPRELTPGAAQLTTGNGGTPAPAARIIPAPAALDNDWAGIHAPCIEANATPDPVLEGCRQAVPSGEVTKRIVVLGDSHAQQYLAALAPIAEARGWELVTLLMPACRFGAESETRNAECNAYNRASAAYVLEHRPDAVFTVATLTHEEAPFETEVPAYLEGIQPLADAGIEVVGIRDNPRFTFSMPECVQRNAPDAPACNPPLNESLVDPSPLESYRGKVDRLYLMDLSDFICAGGICPAVVGNVYVYKDDNHLSRTYVESMIPMFEERLLSATGWT
jgi:peptidoglycan/LPS O-acetylase OafA/YrhL